MSSLLIPFIKSTWWAKMVGDIYSRICLTKRKTIQNWNLAVILPLTLCKNVFLFFLKKNPCEAAASLKKLPCRIDFPHISPIAYLFII